MNQEVLRKFLEFLEKRLKGQGNLRSIYLNCLPKQSITKLDIFELNDDRIVTQKKWASEFLERLLTKDSLAMTLSLKLKYKKNKEDFTDEQKQEVKASNEKLKSNYIKLQKRFKRICSIYEDNLQEYGTRVFGFGYPIIVIKRKSDNKKIKAPLIIWNLSIKHNKALKDSWIIKREEDNEIFFNQPLISQVEEDYGIKLDNISDEMLDDGRIDENELEKIVSTTCEKLNISSNFSGKIKKIITEVEANKSENDLLVEAGVFGEYKQLKGNIIKDISTMKKESHLWASLEREGLLRQDNYFSSMNTDPSQQSVVNSLSKKENTIIHGPPGTGKSQTLTAIITNALVNKNKCLVVCEKRTALEVINKNLKKQSLDRFSVVIENVKLDRKKIVEKARDIIKISQISRQSKSFTNLLKECDSLTKEENLKRQNVSKIVMPSNESSNDNEWRDIIIEFLKNKGEENKDKMIPHLKNVIFEFTIEESHRIEKKLKEAQAIFFQISDKAKILNSDYFKEQYTFSKESGLKDIIEVIEVENGNIIEFLKKNKNSFIHQAVKKLNIFNSKVDECLNFFANSLFVKFFNKKISLNTRAFFFKKYKMLKKEKKFFLDLYKNLIDLHHNDKLFDFSFIEEIKNHTDIKKSLEEYKKKIKSFKLIVREGNIYNKNFYQDNTLIKNVQKNETDKLQKVSQIYSKEIFAKEYLDKLTIEYLRNNLNSYNQYFQEFKKEIDSLIEQGSFQRFYEWFHFFYRLDQKSYEVVKILADKFNDETDNWLKLFNSFYYNKLLEQKEQEVRPLVTDDSNLKKIIEQKREIISSFQKHIFYLWGNKYKNYEDKNFNRIFNLRGPKGKKRNSLKKILHKEFELFTDLFPVLLLTPDVACTVLPLEKDLFDLVIFDEASQLRVQDVYPSFVRGRYKIISGDEKQMPPSNYFSKEGTIDDEDEEDEEIEEAKEDAKEESLLSFVLNNKGLPKEEKYLDFHYRSEHPDLIEFSNKAFYKSRLCPMPIKEDYNPFEFVDVQGICESRINESEAQKVVEKIEEILSLDKEYSIGIATFNINQRDFIKEYIRDKLNLDTLEKLEKNNYFVKNLENIQGDERDIIIISGTYGVNRDNKFKQKFSVSYENGEKLLNVLITRAKRKIIYLNSIPERYYMKYKDREVSRGTDFFYAYIDYVKNVASGRKENAEEILSFISGGQSLQKTDEQSQGFAESPFEEEVLEYLEDEIHKDRIHPQYKVGGFRIDMVIKDKNGNPKIAVECDGAAYHSSDLQVQNDIYRQKIIEEKTNLIFYRIFSTNWWRYTRREAKKLINFINENC